MSWIRRFKWDVAPPDMARYIGRSCQVKDEMGQPLVVECEEVLGCLKPEYATKFQITSKGKWYLISMLDFFSQMNGDNVSEEEIALFDLTAFHVEQKRSSPFAGLKRGKLWTPN